MASSVQKMLLIATLLLASACLASGFAPGSCGSFLSVRAGGSARNTCSMVQLRRSVSAPSLRFASLTLMAKKKDEDEVPEEVVEEATEAPAEEETEEVVEEVDPFAGLTLNSPEFMVRKIEILENELAAANARVEALELDVAPLAELQARGVLSKTSVVELRDLYLRLSADFENFRKRSAGDLTRARDEATGSVLKELLNVLDNFERAETAITTETDREASIQNSYQNVNKEFLKILAKLNVEAIEPLGEVFDPNFHQAIQQAESDEYAEGLVCKAFQRGYRIGDRVLRAALVVVSSGPAVAAEEKEEEAIDTEAKTA